ncbi:MAG: hypothetical protein F9K23_11650 [Bacteroidetes bacterium]|nr:MAG: hypothetical protein F9K23_11650 [Bacteroidota bacterium]
MKLIVLSFFLAICIYSKSQPDSSEVWDAPVYDSKRGSEPFEQLKGESSGIKQKVMSFKELSNQYENSDKSITTSIAYFKFISICSPLLSQITTDYLYLTSLETDSISHKNYEFHYSVVLNAISKVIASETDTSIVNSSFRIIQFEKENFNKFKELVETPFEFIVRNKQNILLDNLTIKFFDYCSGICLCVRTLDDTFRGVANFSKGKYNITLRGGVYCIQMLRETTEIYHNFYRHEIKKKQNTGQTERVSSGQGTNIYEYNLVSE